MEGARITFLLELFGDSDFSLYFCQRFSETRLRLSNWNKLHCVRLARALHPKHQEQSLTERTRQPSEQREQSQTSLCFAESRERKGNCPTEFLHKRHGGQGTMRIVLTSKTKSYATALLLHQVCSALCRHADSRLGLGFAACHSKSRFQRPGAKPRQVQYASLSRPGSP